MPKRFGQIQKWMKGDWLILLLLWSAWGGLFRLGVIGQWQGARRAERALRPLREQAETQRSFIAQFPDIESLLRQQQEHLDQLKKQSLGREAIPRVIQQVAKLAAETGVLVEMITPKPGPAAATGGALPEGVGKRVIEVQLSGAYRTVGEFMAALEGLPVRFTVEKISLRRPPADSEEGVQAQILLGTYGLL